MIKKLNILLLTMIGVGNSKFAPGTMASFITCLIYIIFFICEINIIYLIFLVTLLLIYCSYSIDYFKRSFLEVDAKEIVIDEFIGQSIPLLTIYSFIPSNNLKDFMLYTFFSFILFRIFDIAKPFPINFIDKQMKNGFGVILDDLIAGLYSVIALLIIFYFLNYV
jgi:phosphatidylglycerophosphatase A|tara:strand:+ start:66 stop:560 length:495 start_codon:yes stop_codon:yes gene_type:complete